MLEADAVRKRLPAIIAAEVDTINRTFQGCKIEARTRPALTIVAGRSYISYGIETGRDVLPQHVEKLLPKLTDALFRLRNRDSKERRIVNLRLRYQPLALEINHPFREPLDWHKARTLLKPDTMLAGRNYSGGEPCDDVLSFDDTPHVLIAGTTGSGKSTLMRMMLGTLALNTDPDLLRLYLIDLKNKDLKQFNRLPHKAMFAGDESEALQTIRIVHHELQRRRAADDNSADSRIVVVIDELADVGDRDSLAMLGSILRRGRAYKVHVMAATQLPTKATCGEKNNYTVRFVGAITDVSAAHVAAGRGGSGAHLLPGRGAFLRIEGVEPVRIQAYWLDDAGTEEMVDNAIRRWGRSGYRPVTRTVIPEVEPVTLAVTEPVITGDNRQNGAFLPVSVRKTAAQPVTGSAVTVTFPLPTNRPPSQAEARALRQLYEQTGSITAVTRQAYNGNKNKVYFDYVKQALSEGGAR